MNDTQKLRIETCIEGLAWIILGVLARETAKRPREYVKLKDIREKSGIRDKLNPFKDANEFEHMFTTKILRYLSNEGCIEKSSFLRGCWRITETGLEIYRMGDRQELDLEICIYGLEEAVLDCLLVTGRTGNYMSLSTVADLTGIESKIAAGDRKNYFKDAFTHALLKNLLNKECVEEGPGRGQWKIADLEYQERQA